MARKNKEDPKPLNGETEVLLHVCCAPCSGAIIEKILHVGVKPTLYFYNPNIHPRDEYEIRKEEMKKFMERYNVLIYDGDYNTPTWFEKTKGLEQEPERGSRCDICFDMRLWETARFAHEKGFQLFSTTLGFSRHKDQAQVYGWGRKVSKEFENLEFWDANWRKNGGTTLADQVSKQEKFYRQQYCGCVYSKRDVDEFRKQRDS